MKQFSIIAVILFSMSLSVKAQSVKLDFFTKIPIAIKNCGALYTYDTTALDKKKYIVVVDYQNLGIITVGGKQIQLQLQDTKTVGQTNTATYNGGGYTIIISSKTIKHAGKLDIESGTVQIIKGDGKQTIKIHGQSGCDESKQEKN